MPRFLTTRIAQWRLVVLDLGEIRSDHVLRTIILTQRLSCGGFSVHV
ncbi:hypothetical protein WG66_006377 [Moniliophthora roreri]|nr:hypothetical protein WG66_006377 [Moniliophthora roreri]